MVALFKMVLFSYKVYVGIKVCSSTGTWNSQRSIAQQGRNVVYYWVEVISFCVYGGRDLFNVNVCDGVELCRLRKEYIQLLLQMEEYNHYKNMKYKLVGHNII